jgi:cobalamin biosynthesis Co2+ chelatase CbiK
MLEKTSKYDVIPLEEDNKKILVLHKSTETEDPFFVIAGYFLKEIGDFDERVLAEIETVPTEDYSRLKKQLREKLKVKEGKRIPITFW